MFKIVEHIQAGEDESSRRLLPLQFPTRAAAIEHIELLQLQFIHRGRDKTPEQWWARNEDSLQLYRWVILEECYSVITNAECGQHE
jgi:hypothetical protein